MRSVSKTGPNVLLIVLDAARTRNLSCYGYPKPTTPHLERLAEHSIVYEQAISPAGWSLPAHASIFTGLYPSRHGAHDQHKYLKPEYPTLAEVLGARGYRTLAFCQNQYVGSATGLDRGFDRFNPTDRHRSRRFSKWAGRIERGIIKGLGWQDSGARATTRAVHTALRELQDDPHPFFMFINYLEPHTPYRSPAAYHRFLPAGVTPRQAQRVNRDPWQYLICPESMRRLDFEIIEALHNSAIAYLDARIAQILGWLQELALLDQTLVIITADHGENFGEHQLLGHSYCLYDTLLHVPLIVRYPPGRARPGRVGHQVQTLDLFPTILALLGDTSSELYRSLQGFDLLSSARHPFTVAEQARPDLTPFSRHFPDFDASLYDRALYMIRTDRYKYIWSSTGQHELYDLRLDPAEEHNLSAERPEIARDLDWRLADWRGSFETAQPLEDAPEFDEEVVERLRALGYLE
ncbi:MAG TPA: sulfatase [Anaerolineae bacterium]|nr:sulfatase [Anaerolineae bacterium]